MHIVLDLQGAQAESRFRGIGRYTLGLAHAIIQNAGSHDITLALSDFYPATVDHIRGEFGSELSQDHIRLWRSPGPVSTQDVDNRWRQAAAATVRAGFLASLHPDLVHVTDMFGGYVDDVVSTTAVHESDHLVTMSVYDLIPMLNPRVFFDANPDYERHYRDAIAKAQLADGWLAISRSSAREAQEYLGAPADRIFEIPAACAPLFRKLNVSRDVEQDIRTRYGLLRPFVMYSGGSEVTKNLDGLLQGYAHVPRAIRDQHQLVLAGRMAPADVERLAAAAAAFGLGPDDIRSTGYVSDDDLVLLYNLCKLFVLASTHEGFGLPVLEAMACGAPVIGSNVSSIPEVISWSEALFNPYDTASITAKIERGLTDDIFRTELRRRGSADVERFSWADSGKRAIKSFETLLTSRTAPKTPRPASSAAIVERVVADLGSIAGEPTDQDLIKVARFVAENLPVNVGPRILVDVSALIHTDLRSGIQRVVRALLQALPAAAGDARVEAVYATPGRPGYRIARNNGQSSGLKRTLEVWEPSPGDIFLGLDLEPDLVATQAGFYAELRRSGIGVYFVVYDLLPVLMPSRFPKGVKEDHERWLEVVSKADGALCISRAVADELRAWDLRNLQERNRPFRIGWFHLGADLESSNPSRGVPEAASLVLDRLTSGPSFMSVGTIEPRKGYLQTLDAFELLWRWEVDATLILVGKRGWHMSDFLHRIETHTEFGRRLFWLEGVSDEYLDKLYQSCACLIAASEGEGFGLPLIEAARHGVPIIARDIPVFREVAGDHALFFRGTDPENIANAVQQWIDLHRRGVDPSSDGIEILTWAESAVQVVQYLDEARRLAG